MDGWMEVNQGEKGGHDGRREGKKEEEEGDMNGGKRKNKQIER